MELAARSDELVYPVGEEPNAPPAPPAFPPTPDDVGALLTFPYCVCDDYKCAVNPYRLKYVDRQRTATEIVLRFRLFRVSMGLGAHAHVPVRMFHAAVGLIAA